MSDYFEIYLFGLGRLIVVGVKIWGKGYLFIRVWVGKLVLIL